MKPDKAIDILKELKLHPMHKGNANHKAAVGLGIEALKRLAFNRLNTIASSDEPLPGETKD